MIFYSTKLFYVYIHAECECNKQIKVILCHDRLIPEISYLDYICGDPFEKLKINWNSFEKYLLIKQIQFNN